MLIFLKAFSIILFLNMNFNALKKYCYEIFIYNIMITSVVCLFLGFNNWFFIYPTIGFIFSLFFYKYFKNEEYYMYYNLGITKFNLFKAAYFFNSILF